MSSLNSNVAFEMSQFVNKTKAKIEGVVTESLLEVGRRLVQKSPVGNPITWKSQKWPKGYIPGHFINNWQVGIGVIPAVQIPMVDPTGQGSLQRLGILGDRKVGNVFYFVNNLPYAMQLERGYSKQAPLGMVGLTAMEFPQIVQNAASGKM